jgi:hypothetical protein
MRGFLGLVLLLVAIPFVLKAAAYSSLRSSAEADASSAFISFSRSRFFEANLRQSFLSVLSSARGATPGQVAADAAEKLGQWSAVALEASRQRGFEPSLWVGCGQQAGKHADFPAEFSAENFSDLLSFDPGKSVLALKYRGNNNKIDALGCAKVSIGLRLESKNSSQLFILAEGLYATSNLTAGTKPEFGFEN